MIGEEAHLVDRAIDEWSQVLAECSGDEIKAGLDHLDQEWPPNAYEFRKICKATTRSGSQAYFEAKELPKPSPDVARAALDGMKSLVAPEEKAQRDRADKGEYPDNEWFAKHGWDLDTRDLMDLTLSRRLK